ncbi:methyltransferase domain protein [Gongronella butleri]|nr:methyltransferase domain protein [Gongronella butleri]
MTGTSNAYDRPGFYNEYKSLDRSQGGLAMAPEFPVLQKMLPASFEQKAVLDLGCGYGWHCMYVVEHGAARVLGIDGSQNMLAVAEEKKLAIAHGDRITYKKLAIEQLGEIQGTTFDIVLSSLALHYVESFDDVVKNVHRLLKPGGLFVFSVEHPTCTAHGPQTWHLDSDGNRQHWPVDHYFEEGERMTDFLGHDVKKYHKTVETYVSTLLRDGAFQLRHLAEPPYSTSKDASRKPWILVIAATKTA